MNQTKPIVPIHQIIAFVLFIATALITSLFIYNLNHSAKTPNLSPQYGLLFKSPRDIKQFELINADQNPFGLKDFYHHWTLLFFGFTHCSDVCPATLNQLNKAFQDLHHTYPNLQVVFISIDPTHDTALSLKKYMNAFNPNFIAVTGKIDHVRKVQSQLGIAVLPDSVKQLQHTASILLINPEGKWVGLLNNGLTTKELTKAIHESLSHYHV